MEIIKTVDILNSDLIQTPIDYMSLNESDFENFELKKDILEIPEGQYLSKYALNKIKPAESNTVVVNASVGQGKSRLAIDIATSYYKKTFIASSRANTAKPLYTIIFAVPYKSLIGQYTIDLISNIQKKLHISRKGIRIPDYDNLRLPLDSQSTIHIITINCLLGNPGENSIQQNSKKEQYLTGIIEKAKIENRKIILIFDEIHDGIHNFKQDLIFNLWKFKANEILHKVFILSATYTEASKIIIKYLSELTNKKLQIVETKRTQTKNDKLSNLHLHFTNERHYNFDKDNCKEHKTYLSQIIDKHQNLDILFYSQRQVIKLLSHEPTKKVLVDKYQGINLCVSEEHTRFLNENEFKDINIANRYEQKYCNVGTIFKTGINIEKENTALLIVLPSKYAIGENEMGIFQNVNDVIQAIARVRKKSDIYIIMPLPKKIIGISDAVDDNEKYVEVISKFELLKNILPVNLENSTYKNYTFNEQYELLKKKYEDVYEKVKNEIELIEKLKDEGQRDGLPYLSYPTIDQFILDKGETYLSRYFAIFGNDPSAYMLWAALNNQFVNCQLKSISTISAQDYYFVKDHFLDFLYETVFDNFHLLGCPFETYDYEIYKSIIQFLTFNNLYESKNKEDADNKEGKQIKINNNKYIRLVMSCIQVLSKGNVRLSEKYNKSIERENGETHSKDIPFDSEDYLLCCISNALLYNDEGLVDEVSLDLINAYIELNKIRSLFIDKIIKQDEDEQKYIPSSYIDNVLNSDEIDIILNTIKIIQKSDPSYQCFRKFQNVDFTDKDNAIISIYKELKTTFFSFIKKGKKTVSSKRINVDFIEIKELPEYRSGINLLYEYKYSNAENYEGEQYDKILIDEYNDITNHDMVNSLYLRDKEGELYTINFNPPIRDEDLSDELIRNHPDYRL